MSNDEISEEGRRARFERWEQLYDRRRDEVSLDEVERISIYAYSLGTQVKALVHGWIDQ
jgi:hypothetical protein